MLYNIKELPEIHFMKHRNDTNTDFTDYENQIFDKTISPYMYKNDIFADQTVTATARLKI